MFRPRASAVALTLLLLAVLVPAIRAEPLPWDQEAVTQQARELVDAVSALRQSMRQNPVSAGVTPKNKVYVDWLENLKSLEQSAKQLTKRLEAGAGREQTLPIARKIRSRVRDAERLAASLPPTGDTAVKVGPVVERLDALGPYYFEEAGG